VNDPAETHAATPAYTWRTFLAFWSAAVLLAAVLGVVLGIWLPEKTARGAGIGVSIPLAFSGNRRWREPRILAWAICVMGVMGVLGGVVAWLRGGSG
jgi:hypothetical protein